MYRLQVKHAPKLSWSAGRINPDYIQRYISDPLHVKPGTTMPDVLSTLSAEKRNETATLITHYLTSLGESEFEFQETDPKRVTDGRELFHSIGCVACHSPRDEQGQELLKENSVPLGKLGDKYNLDGLIEFLKTPHEVRPSRRMPDMKLTHWEALDLAHYLTADRTISKVDFETKSSLAARGRLEFHEKQCVQCHTVSGKGHNFNSAPLSSVRIDRGCLSDETGIWPNFALSEGDRDSIRSALSSEEKNLSLEDRIAVTLAGLRCVNCHERNGLGGVEEERNSYFLTTNPNLGPQGRIPPTLTHAGAKLRQKWMRQVLVSGRSIRPYVKTRMPQYGTENVKELISLIQNADQLAEVKYPEFDDQKVMRQTGAEMVGVGGLNCIACHTFQLKQAATMPAVDLTEMAERLQKPWFYHYMKRPQQLSANTIMPSFWPGGTAIRKDILDGDPSLQIEALWQYLLDGRQARTPRGLIIEPIELLATDEAVMLRRSYPEVGKRGIGVGYPANVNIVFDAEQMRLATLWTGKFADPGGVWRSQGHGRVRPLGSGSRSLQKVPISILLNRPGRSMTVARRIISSAAIASMKSDDQSSCMSFREFRLKTISSTRSQTEMAPQL
jgi:mono/diheme cytochrome c family protein